MNADVVVVGDVCTAARGGHEVSYHATTWREDLFLLSVRYLFVEEDMHQKYSIDLQPKNPMKYEL